MFWGFEEQNYFPNSSGRHERVQWANIFKDTEQISLEHLDYSKEASQY